MKTHRWWLPPILLVVSILVTSGTSSAFPGKHLAKTKAKANLSQTTGTNLFVTSSTKLSSEFSPDTNAQRNPHQGASVATPLHSSISSDLISPETASEQTNPVTRALDNAWSSVSGRFSVLNTRGGILGQRRSHGLRRAYYKQGVRSMASNLSPLRVIRTTPPDASKTLATTTGTTTKKDPFSKVDVAIFGAYFCNLAVLTLPVVTIPAIAMEHGLSPHAKATFIASMASLSALGGFAGKLVNGFVCQALGPQRSTVVYLLGSACMCVAMSFTKSLAPIGMFLMGFDFLSSIQWVSNSAMVQQHYWYNQRLKTRGITILSGASTLGALATKTLGAGLLSATNWRTVYRFGALMALTGSAIAFVLGSSAQKPSSPSRLSLFERGSQASAVRKATRVAAGGQQRQSPLASLKLVLGNPIFWMIAFGNSLGHLARVSDKLLGPFLQEVGGISSSMAAALTSSVTVGSVLGIFDAGVFSKIESAKGKMSMIRNNYIGAILSMLALAVCGLKGVSNLVGGNIIMGAITLFSGLVAKSVSFQFYQIPNLVTTTLFSESTSVALSFTDAVSFLVTAGVMGVSGLVVGNFGWSAAWAFMALIFSLGATSTTKAVRPVVVKTTENPR